MAIRKLKDIPEPLLEIPQPPKQLYIEGDLPSLSDHTYIAIVGSRQNTDYGKQVCEDMIAALAGTNAVVVSGLAIGTDVIAHTAALKHNIPTIAVPGSGLDPKVLYPRRHVDLARDIVSAGGALLSEFEPMFRPTVYAFPRRNRIMAGLCSFIFIIEATEKSGTLITSRLATEYNRTVLTVPHPINSPTSAGPSMLLRLGATPITSTAVFLEELGLAKEMKHSDMSAIEQTLFDQLHTPSTKEDLAHSLKTPLAELTTILMTMELKGLIVERYGAYCRR
ncbi:MAG: DNA-processing protein DprA [bacterium]|nr:DNA-processing protein DprA [bacterium]